MYCEFQRSWAFFTFALAVSSVNGGARDMIGSSVTRWIPNAAGFVKEEDFLVEFTATFNEQEQSAWVSFDVF